MALTFADTHNMIALLTKSDASEGFEQIIDFLNTSVIQYALMINPTINVSYIKQFWSSVSLKKKVIITEDSVRQALRLDDADSIDCLPNKEIFAELARMGLVRNVDSPSKFYMYPRFLQLIINAQIVDLSSHATKYTSLALTQKVFANMRRLGKGFFGVDTSLFDGMLVPQQVQDDVADAAEDEDAANEISVEPTLPLPTPATTPPPQQELIHSPSQDASKQGRKIVELDANEDITLETADVQGSLSESQAQVYHLDLEHGQKVLSIQETNEAEPAELEEVLEVVTGAKLMTEVVTTTTTTIIAALIPKASAPRRRKSVIIQDPEEAATASISVQSEVKLKNKGKEILVEEPKPLKIQARIEQDEAFARELEAELNANINWNDVIEQVKRKERQDNTVMRYQAKEYKGEKEIEEEDGKRKSKNLEQKAAKKQKIDEEVEELKTHLQILHNDENDVYTEDTSLALKVHVVDYQIHHDNNKPYNKIIRVDGTHQLLLSFIRKIRVSKSQRGRYGLAKVKSWKLLESYGIHIITFTTTQMILLAG
nr:hypothetical protein [Tanacetum cinerariifolium]